MRINFAETLISIRPRQRVEYIMIRVEYVIHDETLWQFIKLWLKYAFIFKILNHQTFGYQADRRFLMIYIGINNTFPNERHNFNSLILLLKY